MYVLYVFSLAISSKIVLLSQRKLFVTIFSLHAGMNSYAYGIDALYDKRIISFLY